MKINYLVYLVCLTVVIFSCSVYATPQDLVTTKFYKSSLPNFFSGLLVGLFSGITLLLACYYFTVRHKLALLSLSFVVINTLLVLTLTEPQLVFDSLRQLNFLNLKQNNHVAELVYVFFFSCSSGILVHFTYQSRSFENLPSFWFQAQRVVNYLFILPFLCALYVPEYAIELVLVFSLFVFSLALILLKQVFQRRDIIFGLTLILNLLYSLVTLLSVTWLSLDLHQEITLIHPVFFLIIIGLMINYLYQAHNHAPTHDYAEFEEHDELESKVQERTLELNIALQELEAVNKELEKKNTIDELTSLFNRRFYDQKLQAEFRRSRRNLTPLSLVVIDIDHFKKVNDTYGHSAGDQCLVEVAAKMKKCLRRSADLGFRYGGEEFCLILPETDMPGAKALAEELRELIAQHIIHYQSVEIKLTISCGISTYQQQKDFLPEQLFEHADKALYQAKANGRNQVKQHLIEEH